MKYIILAGAICFNIITYICFKYSALNNGESIRKWGFFALGLAFGTVVSMLLAESMRYFSLGVVSTIFSSLTIMGLYLISIFWFNEPISLLRLCGAVVVIIGVIMIAMPGEWITR